MKKLVAMAMAALAAVAMADVPSISNVKAQQRYPWNALVDIDYTITGDTTGLNLSFSVTDAQNGKTYKPATFLAPPSAAEGTHRATWSPKDDGLSIVSTNIVVTVLLTRTVVPPEPSGGHDRVQLWEGGPYWATTNIGAEKPEDYGYYFWWGDTVGYKRENDKWVATDGSSSDFSFVSNNVPTYNKSIATLQSEGWITEDRVLVPEHDAAHVQWGSSWRMPTYQELGDLINNCEWTKTTMNGVSGYIVSGNGDYVSSSIFLPAAGEGEGKSFNAYSGSYGCGYWSSVASPTGGNTTLAGRLIPYTFPNLTPGGNGADRCMGFPVRPVQELAEAQITTASIVGDSVPFLLDTRASVRASEGVETLMYSSLWDGDANARVTIAQNDEILAENLTGEGEWTWSVQKAGTYVLTHTTFTNGVAGKVETATFNVAAKDIALAQVDVDCSAVTYNGSAFTPPIQSATWDGNALVEGTDYTLAYADNVNAGIATITLTGTNLYNGTYTTNFTIRPRALTQGMVEAIGNHPYTGKAQTPKPTVTDAERGVTLSEGVEYTLSYANNTAIGEGIVTVTGKGNYTGSIARAFVIEPSEGSELEERLGGAGKVESDDAGGWIVTITNDIDAANLPIEIPDDFGNVTIDLNGHDLVGGEGQPAIIIVPGHDEGGPTQLTIATSGGDAIVQGGEGAPAVEVAEGAQDGVIINIGEGVTVQGGGDDVVAIDGTVGTNEGTIVNPASIHIPGEGAVTTPKSWKTGQKVTWKAKAAKGSVFAHWEGELVDSLGLSRNELRNPSLQFVVPEGFKASQVSAVFIAVDDDRLSLLSLNDDAPLAPNADVAGLALVDNSESYVTATMSGLPSGLKFNAKTLVITGKPTKPGVYVVKVTAKNAAGYQWAENVEMRVSDIVDARIDFGGLPETGDVGEPYAGKIAAGEFKALSASGLPAGLKLDAKSGAVAGIPTKGGYFTVKVTATYPDKSKATATRLVAISPVPSAEPKRTAYYPLTVISSDAAAGTVSGTGVYAEGKKASISAKPVKGRVFVGWYRDAALTKPMRFASGDYRKASQSVVVPEVRYLFARFVEATTAADPVTGLAGTGTGLTGENEFAWRVGVAVPDGDGVEYESASLPSASASSLPPGVKFDAVKGRFTGVPTKAGTYVATVTVKNASKATAKVSLTIDVAALDEWAQGTFNGDVVSGLATLTVDAKGKISGKILEGGRTWSLSAASFSRVVPLESLEPLENLAPRFTYHATVIAKSGKEIATNEIAVVAEATDAAAVSAEPTYRGVATGTLELSNSQAFELSAWQNLWKRADTKAAQPVFKKNIVKDFYLGEAGDAANSLKLTFKKDGAVSFSGMIGGTKVSGSSQLVWGGGLGEDVLPGWQVTLYAPPKGAFAGLCETIPLELATDGQNVVVDVTSR